jgi:hypothetical protein
MLGPSETTWKATNKRHRITSTFFGLQAMRIYTCLELSHQGTKRMDE